MITEIDLNGIRLDNILAAMEGMTFSKAEAIHLLGGEGKFLRLIDQKKIRCHTVSDKRNAKWFCNAADVLRQVANFRIKKTKSNQ